MERVENIKMDLLKGFACIGVVFIHVKFPGMFGQIIFCVSGYAVPAFFMIAGFYSYGKGPEVIRRRLLKIVKILSCAYLFFFVYGIAFAIKNHQLSKWLQDNFNWKTPIKYLCFCTIDFAIPLWYLIAMIEVYFVWLYIIKNGKQDISLKILPVLFTLQVFITSYCETMELDWFWKINFVTRGMPWFLLGYYLNTPNAHPVRNVRSGILCLIALLGCVITILPTILSISLKFNSIGYIPYTFALFVLTLKNPQKSICRVLEYIGEKLSLYVYIFHVPMGGIVSYVFTRMGINTENIVFHQWKPIIVLGITLIVSQSIIIMLSCMLKSKCL